jgi:CoA:oxalate CoA-transferase
VIKIEDPEDGDPVRRQGAAVNGYSLYFASFNRSKRSLTLDLRSAEGREILHALLRRAADLGSRRRRRFPLLLASTIVLDK